jgi:hypothetical protein
LPLKFRLQGCRIITQLFPILLLLLILLLFFFILSNCAGIAICCTDVGKTESELKSIASIFNVHYFHTLYQCILCRVKRQMMHITRHTSHGNQVT